MRRYFLDKMPASSERSLFTLVENRTSYSFESCELNVFETHQRAEKVNLHFDHFSLTSMISGKKIMKLPNKPAFEYLPGESVVLTPGELMEIDFPEASEVNPTQCMALVISDDAIRHTLYKLKELYPKDPSWGDWEISSTVFHLHNNQQLAETINRILRITKNESGKVKDIMVELTLQEMLIRLMQTQARYILQSGNKQLATQNPLAEVVLYIGQNLTGKINMDKLADIACMSRASFFKKFKESMGITPAQFILRERIRHAQELLSVSGMNITEICYACGFENLSHFITSFRNEVGITPKAYQDRA